MASKGAAEHVGNRLLPGFTALALTIGPASLSPQSPGLSDELQSTCLAANCQSQANPESIRSMGWD